jgi:hypothetical protein
MSLNINPSSVGQINLSGSDTALFLKKFSGMVMATYDAKKVVAPMIRFVTISDGKTHQFPALGTAEAAYHLKGESLIDISKNYLNNIEAAERTINVDRPLTASVMVDDWDLLINHYDTQAEYSRQLGEALANKQDQTLIRVLIKAARSAATLTSTQSTTRAGLVITEANMDTDEPTLRVALRDAMQSLVEKEVPMNDLVALVRPAQYYLLMDGGHFINADYNTNSNGTRANGMIDKAYGFKIMHTNHLPNTLISAEPGELNDYAGDFTNTVAVAFHRDAIGGVRRQGVSIESERKIEYQSTLTVAKFIEGYGVLRPECAVELKKT